MRQLTWVLVLAVLAAPAWAADEAPKTSDSEIREIGDRLLSEAERQNMVDRRMEAAVKALVFLHRDLESNDLVRAGRGGEIQRFAKVLGLLSDSHVPNAARYLASARRQLEQMRPNLDLADTEIEIILKRLSELLDRAKPKSQAEDLLTMLRMIIRAQESLHTKTTQWGRLVFAEEDKAGVDRDKFKGEQMQIAASVRQFEGKLNQAARSAQPGLRQIRLTKAAGIMKKQKVDKVMETAASEIGQTKPIPAVKKQQWALDVLREIEELLLEDPLSAKIQQLQEQKEQIEQVLEKQRELTRKTEDTPKQEFQAKSKELQVEQRNIEKQLDQTPKNKPAEQAQKHMQQARKEMAKEEQQQAVSEQKKAEQDLEQAAQETAKQLARAEQQQAEQQKSQQARDQKEQAAQQVADVLQRQKKLAETTEQSSEENVKGLEKPQKDLGEETRQLSKETPAGKENLEEASKEMRQASEAMEEGEKTDAREHQDKAIAALEEAAQQLAEAQPEEGQPEQPTQPQPAKTDDPDEKGERDFGKEKVAAGKTKEDESHFDHLNPKERESLKQNFARGLPQEYRELLEDYYEALSK